MPLRTPVPLSNGSAAAKSFQSCPTLWDPVDGSPPGSPVPGILQARTLEWAAISFSNAWKWKVKVKSLSRVWLPATPWTAAHQAPLSMGPSRREHWSGVPVMAHFSIIYNILLFIFTRIYKRACVSAKLLQYVWLCVTRWTVAHQAPLSMGFSRQEYWSGLPCIPPGNFPDPGIEPKSLTSPALAGRFFTTRAPWKALVREKRG